MVRPWLLQWPRRRLVGRLAVVAITPPVPLSIRRRIGRASALSPLMRLTRRLLLRPSQRPIAGPRPNGLASPLVIGSTPLSILNAFTRTEARIRAPYLVSSAAAPLVAQRRSP